MPELPEVELVRQALEAEVAGRVIEEVETVWPGSMPVADALIQENIVGSKVVGLKRRGKVLIVELDSQYAVLIHLKMTGQLLLDLPFRLAAKKYNRLGGGHPTNSFANALPDKSTRVIFRFDDGSILFFNDQRKFGWIRLVKLSEVNAQKLLSTMGPEPLESEFTLSGFEKKLRATKRSVKAAILDQSLVAGVGNIYADEALHLAKIHPGRPGKSLSRKEVRRLHDAIQEILRASLEYGGTSFSNYVNTGGQKGAYLARARVFRREGRSCRECGNTIRKIKVAGRGTHFCPGCQKLS